MSFPAEKGFLFCSSNDFYKRVHTNIGLGFTSVWSLFTMRRAFLEEIETKHLNVVL